MTPRRYLKVQKDVSPDKEIVTDCNNMLLSAAVLESIKSLPSDSSESKEMINSSVSKVSDSSSEKSLENPLACESSDEDSVSPSSSIGACPRIYHARFANNPDQKKSKQLHNQRSIKMPVARNRYITI